MIVVVDASIAPISLNTFAPVLKSTLLLLSRTRNLSVSSPALAISVSFKSGVVAVPVKVGLAIGAFNASALVTVVA